MSTPQIELKKVAQKYLNLKKVFPRGKPDLRVSLNAYQVKKIKNAIRDLKVEGGDYDPFAQHDTSLRNFVPIKRGRAQYVKQQGLDPRFKGIFLPGGEKINTNVQFIAGELRYDRAGAPRARSNDLDTSGDENDFIKSAKKILKRRDGRLAGVTAAGKSIAAVRPVKDEDLLIREAVRIFNKYAEMSYNGEMRERVSSNGTRTVQVAAHPAVWGMAILFEGKKQGGKSGKK